MESFSCLPVYPVYFWPRMNTHKIIGMVTINGQQYPLKEGYNTIQGEEVCLRDTHHFAYANMDHHEKGWHFEADKDWATAKYETASAIYWASANPWAN